MYSQSRDRDGLSIRVAKRCNPAEWLSTWLTAIFSLPFWANSGQ
jgi:hypothetical protein